MDRIIMRLQYSTKKFIMIYRPKGGSTQMGAEDEG